AKAPAPACLLLRCRLPLVLPLETLHAPGRVHELLLAGEEGMAVGADFHPDVRLGRARLDDLPAGAGDRRVHIFRMNAHLHGANSSLEVLSLPATGQKRKTPAVAPVASFPWVRGSAEHAVRRARSAGRGAQPPSGSSHRVHGGEKLLVRLRLLQLV